MAYRYATALIVVSALSPAYADESKENSIDLQTIEVKASVPLSEYVAPNATTGTKTDEPLIVTPVSVQVVPAAVIQDQRINRLQEALENVSGLRSHNNDLEGYVYKIRGFTSDNIYRNGLAVPLTIASIEETANLDRIEVLKGPASILYGRIDPGGLINLVSKRPSKDPYYKIEQEIGSYSHTRTQWDATGAINQAGNVTYRLTGAYQDDDSFRDFQGGHRVMVSPVLDFKFTDSTELLLDFQYMKNKVQSDTGFPAIGRKPASIPLSRSFQEPNDPLDQTEGHSIGYEFKHRFNDDWSITNRFLYTASNMWKLNLYATGLNETTGTLDRTTQFQRLDGEVYSTNLDLNGKFDALGAKHNVVVGLDYLHDYYDYNYGEGGGNFPINIFNPMYGGVSSTDYQNAMNGVGSNWFSSVLVEQTGFYFQDQITLLDKLHFLLGGRYDIAKLNRGGSGVSKDAAIADRNASSGREDKQFSPRVGVLYEFMPNLTGYASYSESFGTNNGVSSKGTTFDPEQGKQYEVGVKTELIKGLSANVSVYQLTKENVLTADLSTPDPNDSVASGEWRSRGVELDVLGQLTERISMIGNYAFTDTKVTKDNNGIQGNQFDNVPRNTAKLFLTYDLGSGGLGWKVGGGFYAADAAYGDKNNTFRIPGYVRLDAFTSYGGKMGSTRWTAQLNLHNLLDKDYFDSTDIFYNASPRLNLIPAQPFTANATFRLEL